MGVQRRTAVERSGRGLGGKRPIASSTALTALLKNDREIINLRCCNYPLR